ncbi:50S ribosomal protein L5 [Candidatus Nardonella dryophthoridicola]|uniref:50S ribosomal protein L5 n=1 Tax=Candidatus Nardonella dryophthoridicola TaxID=1971485 RepID=UPI001F3E5792|nr:50S ribosomal protein L5 [Candidatus Nardonella dryophthoridicola]
MKMIKVKLYNFYKKKIIYKMNEVFNYKSIMQVPNISKIVINIGLGRYISDKKMLDYAYNDLSKISCQKPIFTKAKKSNSNFKIRKGFNIGLKVTLRKRKMWSFIEKMIYVVMPRIRDFRGLSENSFDKFGNYNLGIKEHIIFTDIEYDKIYKIIGMDINISIRSNSINESLYLLKMLKFPFKK